MKARDINTVASFELRRAMQSAHGWLYVTFTVIIYGWVTHQLYKLSESLGKLGATIGADNPINELVAWFTDLEPAQVGNVMGDYSPLAFTFFVVVLWASPLLTMLGSFDQIASDIGRRHARYLLLRTDRTSVYIGKFIGHMNFIAIVMAVICALVMVAIIGTGAATDVGGLFGYMVRIWLTSVFFAMPFVALMGFTGAMTGHPFLALLIGVVLQLFLWMISTIGSVSIKELTYVSYIYPTAMKYQLASQDIGEVLVAGAHMMGLTAVFFFFGLLIFKKRDL